MKTSISVLLPLLILCLQLNIFARAGDLDNTFHNDGRVTFEYQPSISSPTFLTANLVQNDGKIVFAGNGMIPVTGGTSSGYIIIRYNPNGLFDTTFGTNGIVRTDVGSFEGVAGLVIQPDGKIILSGERYTGTTATDFAVLRYNPDGTLDNSFDGNGLAVANITGVSNERGGSVALQPDGKIILAGQTDNQTDYSSFDWAIVRFNADGSLDTTFDTDGKVVISLGGDTEDINSIALQSDGKIIVGGFSSNGVNNDFTIVRLNSNGSIDQGFGINGIVKTPIGNGNDSINSVKITPDGKILAAGGTSNGANGDIALARYNSDGSLDTNFGSNGILTDTFSATSSETALSSVLQEDGKIIISSQSGNKAAIVRYNSDGSSDATFGINGKVETEITTFTSATPFSLSLQHDGKIVASGVAFWQASSGPTYFFTARYLDKSFIKTAFDYDGDGKSDVSVFRPSAGSWYLLQSSHNAFFGTGFGLNDDLIAPADFDGDGKTDIVVFRPSNGTWYLQQSTSGFKGIQFGASGDVPVPADYDNDGRADIAVFRPSTGSWYRLNSSNGGFVGLQFGTSEDKPTIGDFDGDGKSDIAVFRPSTGSWYRLNSSNGQLFAIQFGTAEDKPVPADFDGDGKTDVAVFRPSLGAWYRLNSSDNQFIAVNFGIAEDKPVAADYDGDGKADIAVFRPSTGSWYLLKSTSGFATIQFGITEDIPTPNAFVR